MPEIQIADKPTLDIVKTKIDSNLDAAMSSRAAQSTLNTVNTNLSTVVIEVGNIKASSVKARRLFPPGKFSTSQTTWQTALNITGKGALKGLGVYTTGNASYDDRGFCKLTIDGNIIIHGITNTNGTPKLTLKRDWYIMPQDGSELSYNFANSEYAISDITYSFNQSLRIEIYTNNLSAAAAITVYWLYEKEV